MNLLIIVVLNVGQNYKEELNMAMHRIRCTVCNWTTNPHYLITDCIKEKELAHIFGIKEARCDAHDSAFGDTCPKCGAATTEEYRWFSEQELLKIKKERDQNDI